MAWRNYVDAEEPRKIYRSSPQARVAGLEEGRHSWYVTFVVLYDIYRADFLRAASIFCENSKNAQDSRGIRTCRRGRRRGHRRVSLAFLVCPNESLAPSHRVSLGLALIFVASARVRLEFDFGLEFCLCSTLLIAVFAQVPWKLSIRSCL